MDGEQATSVAMPVLKAGSIWGVAGSLSLADVSSIATAIAAVIGAVYSACLLGEWIHKKFWRKKNARRSD